MVWRDNAQRLVGPDWGRKQGEVGFAEYRFAFIMGELLYPQDRSEVAIVGCNRPKDDGDDVGALVRLEGTFLARIDAEDMQPISISESIPAFADSTTETVFPPDQD